MTSSLGSGVPRLCNGSGVSVLGFEQLPGGVVTSVSAVAMGGMEWCLLEPLEHGPL